MRTHGRQGLLDQARLLVFSTSPVGRFGGVVVHLKHTMGMGGTGGRRQLARSSRRVPPGVRIERRAELLSTPTERFPRGTAVARVAVFGRAAQGEEGEREP